jgi:hypothetical protein
MSRQKPFSANDAFGGKSKHAAQGDSFSRHAFSDRGYAEKSVEGIQNGLFVEKLPSTEELSLLLDFLTWCQYQRKTDSKLSLLLLRFYSS